MRETRSESEYTWRIDMEVGDMEVSRALIEGLCKHASLLMERGEFDCRDVRTANALRLARKEILKLRKQMERL